MFSLLAKNVTVKLAISMSYILLIYWYDIEALELCNVTHTWFESLLSNMFIYVQIVLAWIVP